jgi:hypothetical protein
MRVTVLCSSTEHTLVGRYRIVDFVVFLFLVLQILHSSFDEIVSPIDRRARELRSNHAVGALTPTNAVPSKLRPLHGP